MRRQLFICLAASRMTKQLCMCRGVLNGFPQIVGPGDDDAIADEEGGDGDFADQRGFRARLRASCMNCLSRSSGRDMVS